MPSSSFKNVQASRLNNPWTEHSLEQGLIEYAQLRNKKGWGKVQGDSITSFGDLGLRYVIPILKKNH